MLERIKTPADLKKLNIDELQILSDEIRSKIITVASNNGGHLASSLGAVDAIIALYYVFEFPKDKIIFDVGHQAYAHKILSERCELFDTIRTEGGLSGFPNIFESQYDAFTVGHAGTSISASLGYATARDLVGDDYYVISFVGDASFFNGENLEAILSMPSKPTKLLMILNDNGMSISKNSNSFYKVVSKISMKKRYSRFMFAMDKILGWNFIGKTLKKIKFSFKRSLDSYSILDTVGIKYVGPFDGNNVRLLIQLLQNFKDSPRTTLLHIKTKKGKGYVPAETESEIYHGVSKNLMPSINSFSEQAGKTLVELAKTNDKISVITAGMTYGTGMTEFSNTYPDRYFDVGISEEFAVTYSAGMAIAGLKPFVCIYSTFLQRSYDQIMMDVCLQKLPVVFMIDRAGVVGFDGATHQGVFDLSYLRHIPNITVLTPATCEELDDCISYALKLNKPVAIRYCNGKNDLKLPTNKISDENLWQKLKDGKNFTILACGKRMVELAQRIDFDSDFTLYNVRSVKPLDEKALLSLNLDAPIISLEDNALSGGFGGALLEFFSARNLSPKLKILGIKDYFVNHASVDRQLNESGLTVENIKNSLEQLKNG